ncbi:DUF2721 domain-containing protein [Patescibacteria group bacterium]
MITNTIILLLQAAIGPVVLISAIGLLLLTLNNRLMHATDRARTLGKENPSLENKSDVTDAQIKVIWKRLHILRLSIECALFSAFFSSLLIISMFITLVYQIQDVLLLGILFIISLVFLILSVLFLIFDIHKSLAALKFELHILE